MRPIPVPRISDFAYYFRSLTWIRIRKKYRICTQTPGYGAKTCGDHNWIGVNIDYGIRCPDKNYAKLRNAKGCYREASELYGYSFLGTPCRAGQTQWILNYFILGYFAHVCGNYEYRSSTKRTCPLNNPKLFTILLFKNRLVLCSNYRRSLNLYCKGLFKTYLIRKRLEEILLKLQAYNI